MYFALLTLLLSSSFSPQPANMARRYYFPVTQTKSANPRPKLPNHHHTTKPSLKRQRPPTRRSYYPVRMDMPTSTYLQENVSSKIVKSSQIQNETFSRMRESIQSRRKNKLEELNQNYPQKQPTQIFRKKNTQFNKPSLVRTSLNDFSARPELKPRPITFSNFPYIEPNPNKFKILQNGNISTKHIMKSEPIAITKPTPFSKHDPEPIVPITTPSVSNENLDVETTCPLTSAATQDDELCDVPYQAKPTPAPPTPPPKISEEYAHFRDPSEVMLDPSLPQGTPFAPASEWQSPKIRHNISQTIVDGEVSIQDVDPFLESSTVLTRRSRRRQGRLLSIFSLVR